jgi:hypothetical protein
MKEVPRVFTALPYTDIARPVGRVPNGLGGWVVILISFWTQISPIAPSCVTNCSSPADDAQLPLAQSPRRPRAAGAWRAGPLTVALTEAGSELQPGIHARCQLQDRYRR